MKYTISIEKTVGVIGMISVNFIVDGKTVETRSYYQHQQELLGRRICDWTFAGHLGETETI